MTAARVNEMSVRDLLRAEADRLEQNALLSDEDGNGEPAYMRATASALRAEAKELEGGWL